MITSRIFLRKTESLTGLHLFKCWIRIAEIIEEDFFLYLSDICKMSIVLINEDISFKNYNTRSYAGRGISIKIEEKNNIFQMLQTLAKSCPKCFSKYIEKITQIIINKIESSEENEKIKINQEAIRCLICFSHGLIKIYNVSYLQKIIECVIKFFKTEKSTQVKVEILKYLFNLFNDIKQNVLVIINHLQITYLLKPIVDNLRDKLTQSVLEIETALSFLDIESEFKGDLKRILVEEENSINKNSKFISLLYKIYGSTILSSLEVSINLFNLLLNKGHIIQKINIILILSNIIKFSDGKIIFYLSKKMLPIFWKATRNKSFVLREVAFSSLSVIILKFPGLIYNHHNILREAFIQFKIKNMNNATKSSACTCILRILLEFEDKLNNNQLYNVWLEKCFPIMQGKISARYVIKTIYRLLRKNNSSFTGENMSNLPKIINVLMLYHQTDSVDIKTNNIFKKILETFKKDHNLLRNLYRVLDLDSIKKINMILNKGLP